MTGYVLDTNVVSELRKVKPHGGVVAWLQGLREDQIHICAVTIGELQRGIERIRKQDKAKAVEIETWLDQLEASRDVIPMDARCFREWARLMEGKSGHLLEDAMIAAIARVHHLKVATRTTADFASLSVDFLNPFKI
jgi:hypothetical protein